MDYSKLSDLEINGYVLHRLNQGKSSRQQQLSVASGEVDYCNKPADAWPIIKKHRITLMPSSIGDNWMAQAFDYAIADVGTRPLRSAMIVYLMMQEGK